MNRNLIDELAVFVDSFDGMSDVWKYYFEIFDKYWPDCSLNRYLVTNSKDFAEKNLKILKTGGDRNWFTMTYKALLMIKNKYIFFMIEDDFMSEYANEQLLSEIIDYMENNDVFFYRFTCPLNYPKNQGYIQVHGDVIYPISIQPAIWRTEKLIEALAKLESEGCKSPWDFERYFIELYKNYDNKMIIPGIRYDSRGLFGFTNGIIQGLWDPRIVRFYSKRGIEINTGERGVMPRTKVLADAIKSNKIIHSMSFEKQLMVKNFLKKLGFRFIT